jgi:SAM-dependent methyltransferase
MEMQLNKWPKKIPVLTPEQEIAREGWMRYWHQVLPNRFGLVEKFNQGFPAQLPLKSPCKTLEVGAGLGEHLRWENLQGQDYYCLEYREEWAENLKKKHDPTKVIWGDIQTKLDFDNGTFDRIIAIHVLEHLPDLPRALGEIDRLLKPTGSFDIVIPCEGGLAYHIARELTSARMFRNKFQMSYQPIMAAEHINRYPEIIDCLRQKNWKLQNQKYFPFRVPLWNFNFCVGLRYVK